ncbi:MAG: hypothetical protein ACYSUT_02455, partial [Planctomycetota bacterium]
VALMIAAVVLGAVATLADATACANEATEEMGREQAQLRHVTMRLTDLIKRANQVTIAATDGFELWHDTNADGVTDADELTQIARGSDGDTVIIGGSETHSQCSNVVFQYDAAAPDTRFVAIWFEMDNSGVTQTHTVNAKLRVSDDH